MEISARNALKGIIKKVLPGAVNTEIIVEVANGLEVVAIITKESAERLNLSVGKETYAVIKALCARRGLRHTEEPKAATDKLMGSDDIDACADRFSLSHSVSTDRIVSAEAEPFIKKRLL